MKREVLYFLLNGGFATAVHFFILLVVVESFSGVHIALANTIAGIGGVLSSFLGNRYFVFKSDEGKIHYQALKFIVLYIFIIMSHTFLISILTVVYGVDYRVSFVIASAIMLVLSFLSNKFMVFR